MKIQILTPLPVNVSEKTEGMVVNVDADNGLAGYGECTLSGGWEAVQLQCFARLPDVKYAAASAKSGGGRLRLLTAHAFNRGHGAGELPRGFQRITGS